jgi:hypothetical protein
MKPLKVKIRSYQVTTLESVVRSCFYKTIGMDFKHTEHYECMRDFNNEMQRCSKAMLAFKAKQEQSISVYEDWLVAFEALIPLLGLNEEQATIIQGVFVKIDEAKRLHKEAVNREHSALLNQIYNQM